MQKVWFKFVILPLALCGIIGISGYFWLRTSLPDVDGEIRVSTLAVPIEIARTEHGLVSIEANALDDVWFGLGFAHAQDRLWQMMSMRRFALGRLSEVIGEDTLELDKRQRRLGFGRLAKAQFNQLDPATKTALTRYADGINAFLIEREGALPLEFQLLGFDPIPWEPWHGLLWGRLMAHQLTARWREDLARATLLPLAGGAKMQELWPEIGAETDIPSRSNVLPSLFHPDPKGASNAWAVSPLKSKTGSPLLAGDPHLGLAIPGIWYVARLKAGEHVIEGATTPGVPFVIIGRNQGLAWSLTSNEADLQDVVNVTREDVTSRINETILVDDFPEPLTIAFFIGAPVITGELAESGAGVGQALLSTALGDTDRSPDALMRLNTASTVNQGIAALELFAAPFLNVILADRSGDIARVHAGVLPVRRLGVSGRLPLTPDNAWALSDVRRVETIERDPAAGFIANANEKTPELDEDLAGDWPLSARDQRINALLSQPLSFSLDDMATFQTDIRDVTWNAWRFALSGIDFIGEEAQAYAVLRQWDGEMRRELAAPLIYSAWIAHIRHLIFADELGERMPTVPLPGPTQLAAMIKAGSKWCDNIDTSPVENCDRIAETAFRSTIETLSETLGSDIDDWHWGDTHVAQFHHALLGRIPFFADYYDRRIETDGGDRTLNRGASPRSGSAKRGFPHVHGAGVRAIHDLSGAPSRYMVGPGQSGNPFSDHYDDLLEPWRDGEYVGFDAPRESLLRLLPGVN